MSRTGPDTGQAPALSSAGRLDSWKEISTYLNRDASTLRRWEEREGLPIHRERQQSKVVIYAYKSELDAWLRSRSPHESTPSATALLSADDEPIVNTLSAEPSPLPVAKLSILVAPRSPQRRSRKRSKWIALIMTAVIVIAALGAIYKIWGPRHSHGPRIRSIAVLPMKDISVDGRAEYFGAGITEELITDLARLKRLRVMARTSTLAYEHVRKPIAQMGEELNVDVLVEGYLQRGGNHVRITARLFDTKTASVLWANSFEGQTRNLLLLQKEVTRSIARVMQTELPPHQPLPGPPADLESLEAYFKGHYYSAKLSCEGYEQAAQSYQQAVSLAPNYALAHARLARTYFKLAESGCFPQAAVIPRARASAARAIALDPNLGEGHAVLGMVSFLYDWDWSTAHGELKRATELSSNDAVAHSWYGAFLFATGKQREGFSELKRAQDVDPAPGATSLVYASMLYNSRRYEDALIHFQQVVDAYPESVPAHFGLAAAYERRRMRTKALKSYIRAKELSGATPEAIAALRAAFRSGGLPAYWRKELQMASAVPDVCRSTLSAAHLGDKGQVLSLLERAYSARCSALASLRVDPLYDGVRREPRFQQIVRRMGLVNSGSTGRSRSRSSLRATEKANSEKAA